MNDDNKRLSVENFIDDENRVSALEGETPETFSGTFTVDGLTDLGDRITTLEGGTPEPRDLTMSELLYYDDRITALEEAQDDVTLTYDVNGGTGSIAPVTVDAGSEVTLNDGSTITAPEGKVFDSWTETKDDDTTKITTDKITLSANKTIYAYYVVAL